MISLVLAFWFINATGRAAEVSYVKTPAGEVISDIDPGLPQDPALAWGTDPFLKIPGFNPRPVENVETKFILQGTVADSQHPTAIVNEQLVKLGDEVNGRRVRKVGEDYILLEKGGSLMELGLYDKTDASNEEVSRSPASVTEEKISPPTRVDDEPEIQIEEVKSGEK